MKQQDTAKLWASFGKIGQVRQVLNDAMNKGYKIYYQEEGNFFEKVFTIKGNTEDVNKVYKHIMSHS